MFYTQTTALLAGKEALVPVFHLLLQDLLFLTKRDFHALFQYFKALRSQFGSFSSVNNDFISTAYSPALSPIISRTTTTVTFTLTLLVLYLWALSIFSLFLFSFGSSFLPSIFHNRSKHISHSFGSTMFAITHVPACVRRSPFPCLLHVIIFYHFVLYE